MSFTKFAAATLVLTGLTTAAHAESDDNHASTTVLNALASQRAVASEAYASVPGMAYRGGAPYAAAVHDDTNPLTGALPTQTNN